MGSLRVKNGKRNNSLYGPKSSPSHESKEGLDKRCMPAGGPFRYRTVAIAD